MENVNFVAVVLAAFSAFMVGGIWYGGIFAKTWMKENGFSQEYLAKRNLPVVFGVSFLLSFVSAFFLEMFIGPESDLLFALFASVSVGLVWVAGSVGVTYLFEKRSIKLFLINGGYHFVSFLVMGLLLGMI